MERLNHQEPLSHVPMQATLTPATTSQRRLRRSVFQAIALPLLSLGLLSACSNQAIKPASGDPTDSAVSALTTCSGNMFTATGTPVQGNLPTAKIGTRAKEGVGVNHWSGEGVGLLAMPGMPWKTVTSTFDGKMPVRRFPGGLGGLWDWHDGGHPGELGTFIQNAKNEGVKRLFFVVNTNGVFHLGQDGTQKDSVVPDSITGANTVQHCITAYNYVNCKAEMAKHARLFAEQVVSKISAAWGSSTASWPEIVFEIGNEFPLLERRSITCGSGSSCTTATYDRYAEVFYAYRTQIDQAEIAGVSFKYAVAGLFPEHAGYSIWDSIKNYEHDFRVIHDYGFAPEVNNKTYGSGLTANNWGNDCQSMVQNGVVGTDGPTVYGLAKFSPHLGKSSIPIVITEFGTPDFHCPPCTTTCITPAAATMANPSNTTPISYTEAVLNDSLLATKRMNISDSNILSVNLKWPAKANSGQEHRSWQKSGTSDVLLPVYHLHKMMGPFLNALQQTVPGNWGTIDGLRYATASDTSYRYAVFTNLTNQTYQIQATGLTGITTATLTGILGAGDLRDLSAEPTTIGECNKAISGTTLEFGIAPNSVVVVTY